MKSVVVKAANSQGWPRKDWSVQVKVRPNITVQRLTWAMVELLWKARVEDVDESTIRLWLKAGVQRLSSSICGWLPVWMHPDETLDELGFFKEKPINESGDAAILIEFRQKNSWPRDWIALAQKQISMFLDSIRPVPSPNHVPQSQPTRQVVTADRHEMEDDDDDAEDLVAMLRSPMPPVPPKPNVIDKDMEEKLKRDAEQRKIQEEKEREAKLQQEKEALDKTQAEIQKYFEESMLLHSEGKQENTVKDTVIDDDDLMYEDEYDYNESEDGSDIDNDDE